MNKNYRYVIKTNPDDLDDVRTVANKHLSKLKLRVFARPTPADPADWHGKSCTYGLCDHTAGYYRFYPVTASGRRVALNKDQHRKLKGAITRAFGKSMSREIFNENYDNTLG